MIGKLDWEVEELAIAALLLKYPLPKSPTPGWARGRMWTRTDIA